MGLARRRALGPRDGAAEVTKRRTVRLTQRDDDVIVQAAGLLGISPEEFMIHRALVDADLIVNGAVPDLLDPATRTDAAVEQVVNTASPT
jgi:hypothetical protein